MAVIVTRPGPERCGFDLAVLIVQNALRRAECDAAEAMRQAAPPEHLSVLACRLAALDDVLAELKAAASSVTT